MFSGQYGYFSQPKRLNIVVVGEYAKIFIYNFICGLEPDESTKLLKSYFEYFGGRPIEYFNQTIDNVDYKIINILDAEKRKSPATIAKEFMKDADAVICCYVDENDKKIYQQAAPKHCQFIIYNLKTMTPKECIAIETKANHSLISNVNDKIKLLFKALNYDKDSPFALLPKEITQSIAKDLASFTFINKPHSARLFNSANNPEFVEQPKQTSTKNVGRWGYWY